MNAISESKDSVMCALVEAARRASECANATRTSSADISRLCLDAADMCWFALSLLARGSHFIEAQLTTVARVLEVAARDCRNLAGAHGIRCAEACEAGRRECGRLLGQFPVEGVGTGQRAVDRADR